MKWSSSWPVTTGGSWPSATCAKAVWIRYWSAMSIGPRNGTDPAPAAGEVSVAIEDADPLRNLYGSATTPPLSSAQIAQWQQTFAAAWAEIKASYPEYEPAIRTGLTVLVPLASEPGPNGTGAVERHAFGAVAVPWAADPARMSQLIVTAFQRAKFGGVIDLFDLCDLRAANARS